MHLNNFKLLFGSRWAQVIDVAVRVLNNHTPGVLILCPR